MRLAQRLSRSIAVAVVIGAAGTVAIGLSTKTFAGSDEIIASAKNADLWPAPGRDLSLTRHSPVSYTHLDVYKRQGLGLPHDTV